MIHPTRIVNNLKRSFNRHLENAVKPSKVNYDDESFDTSALLSWYSIRYMELETESPGMGDLIDESKGTRGRIHRLNLEMGAWTRNDPQRIELGLMVDRILSICGARSIPMYDFADPENPEECGTILIIPRKGLFSPAWTGGGGILRTSSNAHAASGITGFVMKIELKTLAEEI